MLSLMHRTPIPNIYSETDVLFPQPIALVSHVAIQNRDSSSTPGEHGGNDELNTIVRVHTRR